MAQTNHLEILEMRVMCAAGSLASAHDENKSILRSTARAGLIMLFVFLRQRSNLWGALDSGVHELRQTWLWDLGNAQFKKNLLVIPMVIVRTWASVNCHRVKYSITKQGFSDPPEQVAKDAEDRGCDGPLSPLGCRLTPG